MEHSRAPTHQIEMPSILEIDMEVAMDEQSEIKASSESDSAPEELNKSLQL